MKLSDFMVVFRIRSSLLVALVSVGGCLVLPQSAKAAEVPAATVAPPNQVPPPELQPDYRLGPGDTVQIFVWRNPELSVTVPVRPDGKVSTPLVDDMVANGKTPSQLARDMEQVLSEYVRNPKVYVIVTGSTSAANQIKVIGQVQSPQSLPYRAGMTALDAIMGVGGLTDFASGNRAKILRKAPNGDDQVIKVRFNDLMKGKLKDNVKLQPGDVLVVPESFF